MYINANTSISTSKVLLVPYEAHHVPTYHEWMKDPEIQILTASEPLSLAEEYAMQKSWRSDRDKLTFIACLPISAPLDQNSTQLQSRLESSHHLTPQIHDTPSKMIGDINLFLSPYEEEDEEEITENDNLATTKVSSNPSPAKEKKDTITYVVGEIELMIAQKIHRHQGYGRTTLISFIHYISTHLPQILTEYTSPTPPSPLSHPSPNPPRTTTNTPSASTPTSQTKLKHLRAKISKENVASVRLFESIGFRRRGGENWFGEVEMVFDLGVEEGGEGKEMLRWGIEGWVELGYGSVEGGVEGGEDGGEDGGDGDL